MTRIKSVAEGDELFYTARQSDGSNPAWQLWEDCKDNATDLGYEPGSDIWVLEALGQFHNEADARGI